MIHCLGQLRAAVTKYLSGLHKRNVFSHSSANWKSEIGASLASSDEGSTPGLDRDFLTVFLTCGGREISLFLFLEGQSPIGLEAKPSNLIWP